MNEHMKSVDMIMAFKENGFVLNPYTHKWCKNGVSSSYGEMPTTYMSEEQCNERVWHGNVYVRKQKVD